MKPILIIITGLPCTGKTTRGKYLAEHLNLPFFSKDVIKESLFDNIGWSDRPWAKKLGQASHRILDYIMEEELRVGHSLVLETDFKPEFDNLRFQNLQQKFHFQAIQILCYADSGVLFERFKERALSSKRHPGHADGDNLDEFKQVLAPGRIDFLALDSQNIEVDTTDLDKIDDAAILRQVKEALLH